MEVVDWPIISQYRTLRIEVGKRTCISYDFFMFVHWVYVPISPDNKCILNVGGNTFFLNPGKTMMGDLIPNYHPDHWRMAPSKNWAKKLMGMKARRLSDFEIWIYIEPSETCYAGTTVEVTIKNFNFLCVNGNYPRYSR